MKPSRRLIMTKQEGITCKDLLEIQTLNRQHNTIRTLGMRVQLNYMCTEPSVDKELNEQAGYEATVFDIPK